MDQNAASIGVARENWKEDVRKTGEVREHGNTTGYTSLNVHFKIYFTQREKKRQKKNRQRYETECVQMVDDNVSNSLYGDDATRSRIFPPFSR